MENWTHKLAVKPEAGDKVEMAITANLTGLDLNPFVERGLRDFAANAAKVVRDGDKTADEFVALFQDAVERYSRREKIHREGGAAKVDSTESLAIKKLAVVLKEKFTASKIPSDLPRADNVPMTEKGKPNWIAWAKELKAVDHKWYATAYKLVSNDKGFE